jgi:anti-sigma factor RsiW
MTTPPEDLLSAYLDDELDTDQRARVERQLEGSAEWREVLAELRETRELLRGLPMQEAPASFFDELLRPDAAPGVAAGVTEPTSLDARRKRRTRVAGWIAGGAAAAAIAAVILMPTETRVKPAVATMVSSHAARSSVSEEPVSELAPVATPVRLGR